MKIKLPIGIQSFEDIRTGNYYYVDKTEFVYKLVNTGKYYFLSRPRRFGKSLLIDTIKQAFLGKKELFKGLFLENNWDWSVKYPVIHIDFGSGQITDPQDLKIYISQILIENMKKLGVECDDKTVHNLCLRQMIINAREEHGQKVVVLVDEYDKPILDNITDKEKAKQIREILKNLYSVLKPLDEHLKFVMLTGVSKFSKVSVFSGLNQLNDITVDKQFSAICGYTERELIDVFKDRLDGEDIDKIRDWYNGYSFCGERVYNPFDILLYFDKKEFRPFWFETGTPEFLIRLILDKRFYIPKFENLAATDDLIGSFDLDFIEPEPVLFQTGYLTIKQCEQSFDGVLYYLSYPNKEVRISLNRYLLRYYTQNSRAFDYVLQVRDIFKYGNLDRFQELLKSLFASIPNDWYRKNKLSEYEGYYASVVYSFLASTGLQLIAEDTTNRGRIDLTVIYDDKVYIIEFKVVDVDKSRKGALRQIEEMGYHQKYIGRFKDIYLVGVEFSKKSKDVKKFMYKKL